MFRNTGNKTRVHRKFSATDIASKRQITTAAGNVIEIVDRTDHVLTQKVCNECRKMIVNAKLRRENFTNRVFILNENPNWTLLVGKNGETVALYNKNLLGKGGFGDVRLGIKLDTSEQFAIKIQEIKDPKHILAITQENSLHKQAGTLIDTVEVFEGENLTTVYSIQRLLWGDNLNDLLHHHKTNAGRLPLETEIDMCLSIVEDLKDLNERGILHRDIKTDQVLWDQEYRKASITDLGLAIRIDEAKFLKEVVGNYPAVPPELWEKVRIDNYNLYVDNGCEQGETTEIFGVATILADVLSELSPHTIHEKYYEIFDPLRIKGNTAECAKILRGCHQEMFDHVDTDPIRDAMIRLIDNMLHNDPKMRPTFTEVVNFLKLCQQEIKFRSQYQNQAEYKSSKAFQEAEQRYKRTSENMPVKPRTNLNV